MQHSGIHIRGVERKHEHLASVPPVNLALKPRGEVARRGLLELLEERLAQEVNVKLLALLLLPLCNNRLALRPESPSCGLSGGGIDLYADMGLFEAGVALI